MYIFLYYVGVKYIHLHYIFSNIISYVCSIGVAYVATSAFVFRSKSTVEKIIVFSLTRVAFLVISSFVIWIQVDIFTFNEYIAQLIATFICFVGSYVLNRKLFKCKNDVVTKGGLK